MSISTELLNTTLADLRGPLDLSFAQNIPLWRILEKKGKMLTEGGTYIERSFMGSASSNGTGMFNGDEVLDLTRRKNIKKFQLEPHRLVVPITIPKRELLQNSGKNGAIKLIESYPKATMEGAALDINTFLLTGASAGAVFASAELYGFLTLNGQFASGVGTGVTNGLLDFAAPASQTDIVQNVAKDDAYFHYNQYDDISSWATEGLSTIRSVYRKCAQFSGKVGGGPDLVVMDDATFGNYQLEKTDLVRIQLVGDKTDNGNLVQDVLGVGGVYSDLGLSLSAFTGDAADGVTYMLNTDHLEWVWLQKPTLGKFGEDIADQDVVVAKWEMMGQLVCRKTVAQGCVSGGAS
jgi:hypothetical protein